MNNPLCRPHEHRLSRRQWMGQVGAGVVAGGLAPPLLAETVAKKHRQVLMVWLDGGISQLESWDPKPNTRFGGPFRAIPTTVPGIHVSELLPRTARQMHHLALVRSLSTQDNSHSAGVARIQRGDPKNRGVTYPYFGSAVAKFLGQGPSGLPPYVWIKPGNGGFITQDTGFLPAQYGALALGDGKPPDNLLRPAAMSSQEDADRRRLREAADRRYASRRVRQNTEANCQVFDMAARLEAHRALFDASTFPRKDVDRYGPSDLGRHMLLGRRLLEAGVTFVKVNSYGWDTHGDNFNGQKSLVGKFDQAFAALIEDLADRRMLDRVLVIAISEFGRTPRINGHLGRDHWPEAWSVAMAGCGLQRGVVVGKTNPEGTWVVGDEHDIGHVFHTWFAALGIDAKQVEYDNAGQPLPIAHEECFPILDLLA
ncbi:MAG: DUF1501 domain-containing protein [Gemmataceae bacterium]